MELITDHTWCPVTLQGNCWLLLAGTKHKLRKPYECIKVYLFVIDRCNCLRDFQNLFNKWFVTNIMQIPVPFHNNAYNITQLNVDDFYDFLINLIHTKIIIWKKSLLFYLNMKWLFSNKDSLSIGITQRLPQMKVCLVKIC